MDESATATQHFHQAKEVLPMRHIREFFAVFGLPAVFFLALLASLAIFVCSGCEQAKRKPCPDDDCDVQPDGPRPHSHSWGVEDAGQRHEVRSGDVVRIKLPCSGGTCWSITGRGMPHLILEESEAQSGATVFRFRAAAPGSCRLRFAKGSRDLEYPVSVRP